MIVTFLSAKLPLTKTINELGETVRSYPLVRNFTSHYFTVDDLQQFTEALTKCAQHNMCFLKGNPVRPIKNESRAGLTNSITPTELLVLDYDGDALVSDIDTLLYEIHPPLVDCNHIIQYSARAGFDDKSKLRCHIFFHLDKAVAPDLLKQWVLDKNFRSEMLHKQLNLTANCMALTYPLDQTVNQNDKLIFIAPPVMSKGKDPIKNRILYVPRKNETLSLSFPPSPEVINEEKMKVMTELRLVSGLPKKIPRSRIISGEEICTNPGKVMVTGQKKERGFVYLNLNGGDSWGYYFSEKNPNVIRNFKGEPFFFLKDVAPELYKEYCKIKTGNLPGIPVVFRDLETDRYYNMLINQESEGVTFMHLASSKERLVDFLAQYGVDAPEYIEDFRLIFNPQSHSQYDLTKKLVNKFIPTRYMDSTDKADSMPPIIQKVIRHICVDEQTYNHFINWVAFIFQRKVRAETAWVFQGTQGTGKGFVFNQLLRRLFGMDFTQPVTLESLQENFNEYLQDKFLIFVDEIDIEHSGQSHSQGKMMNKLKNLITEPTIGIRAMHKGVVNKANYASFIFASNDVASLYIPENDRRFNIAPRQEKPLDMSRDELQKAIDVELPQFANFLRTLIVNEKKVRDCLQNQAKLDFISDNKTSIEEFFECFRNGDLAYFHSAMHEDVDIIETERDKVRARLIFKRWEIDALKHKKTRVSVADLGRVFFAMQGGVISMNKFGRMCSKNGMNSIAFRLNNKPVRGYTTEFVIDNDYVIRPENISDVVDIKTNILA